MIIARVVIEYFEYQRMFGDGVDIEDEYLKDEGIVPDDSGVYEYDESMHLAKEISQTLNDKHQREAIVNFQSMAHQGKVQASEIYLIPWQIERPNDDGTTWSDSPTSMRSYEELRQFGERINPQQLLMDFMK